MNESSELSYDFSGTGEHPCYCINPEVYQPNNQTASIQQPKYL